MMSLRREIKEQKAALPTEASAYCRIKSVCTVSKLSSSLIPAPFLFPAVEAAAAFAAAGVNAAFTFIASSDKPRRLALQSIQLSYWYSYRGVYCSWLLALPAVGASGGSLCLFLI